MKNLEFTENVKSCAPNFDHLDQASKQDPTLFWVKHLYQSKTWNSLRFKKLKTGYPQFNFLECLIDEVELKEFQRDEYQRIPLFIGCQFGIIPKLA
jgi:hypothetical protein